MRGLLRRMGAQPALADDLAQDAFVIAFERVGSLRAGDGFPAWVRTIAARLYLRRLRGRLRLETPLDEVELDGSSGGETAAVAALDLDAALAALPAVERVCVSLCHGAGFTHEEIATSLGAPLGTVKSHVRRGLAKLRDYMATPSGTPARD